MQIEFNNTCQFACSMQALNFFAKVATIRVNAIADHVISPTQTTFMRGCNIVEGVVILHETIHELHRKKQNVVIFKINFEKAYDKVRWPFLIQTLRTKGFSPKWMNLLGWIFHFGR